MTMPMLEELQDDDGAVGLRIKRIREITGLSKRDFAASIGVSEQSYGQFENAQRTLTLEAAKKIRKRYRVSLEFMYFGKIDDLPHRIAKEL